MRALITGSQGFVGRYLRRELEESGYEGYMVVEAEQDPDKANPLKYAMMARKFISEKTGL